MKQDKNKESDDIEFVIDKFSSQLPNNVLSLSPRPNVREMLITVLKLVKNFVNIISICLYGKCQSKKQKTI